MLNHLNLRMGYGNLEMAEDGAAYYRWALDVEGATASPEQFGNLIGAASSAFDEIRSAAIGAAAFTKLSAEQIIGEYQAAVEAKAAKLRPYEEHAMVRLQ